MKHELFDWKLVNARPKDAGSRRDFTDKVMNSVLKDEILSSRLRKMNVNKKETFTMKLRHLPKFAIVAIAVGALAVLTGTTYAVVQTIKELSAVQVDKSGVNTFGREELHVAFEGCSSQEKRGTTYEIKRGSHLSAEDGAKVLEARCQLDALQSWADGDPKTKEALGGYGAAIFMVRGADTVDSIDDVSITMKDRGVKKLPQDARFINDNKVVTRSDIKKGDTVVYLAPNTLTRYPGEGKEFEGIVVFKLPLQDKYYNLNFQSYVTARGPCMSNPGLKCLVPSNINHTTLMVALGGARHSIDEAEQTKMFQGLVVGYDANSIRFDVGDGKIYTVQTTFNVIDKYNTVTVYGLASFDGIYSKTAPEDLKIKIGDSMEVAYLEMADEHATTITWAQTLGFNLMVERIPDNLDVLRKY